MSMDSKKNVLVHLFIDGSKCEYYSCKKNFTIGISVLLLHKIIRTVTNNNTITFALDENDINHLEIKIDNGEKNMKSSYKLKLFDLPNSKMYTDSMEYNSVITLPSVDFQKICRDMANIGDEVEVKDVQNQLIFTCSSQEKEIYHEAVIYDGETSAKSKGVSRASNRKKDAHDIVQGVFPMKYLNQCTKFTPLCTTVDIMLRNDYPMLVRYYVASLGELKLCLAPKEGKNETIPPL
jgi:proliferating cell nuclear antigen